jgi:hypothetical protein
VQKFRVLYFRKSVLEHAEELQARDVLEAIEKASSRPSHFRVELWDEERRADEIGPSPTA